MYRGLAVAAIFVCGAVADPADLSRQGQEHDEPEPPKLGIMFHFNQRSQFWFVAEVVEGSPAEQAGVKPGDILLVLAGIEVAPPDNEETEAVLGPDAPHVVRMKAALKSVAQSRLGDDVQVEIERDGEQYRIAVHLQDYEPKDTEEQKRLLWDRVVPSEIRMPEDPP